MAVLASIDPAQLQVDPGAEASLVVRVRNRGTIVDRFDIAVVGPMAPWASVDPPALRLFPDKEGEARISFRPPRAPQPAADTYPFGIAVRAASDPSDTTVEEGRVTVAPFVELGAEIVPQTSRGSRSGSHEVTVHNRGNAVAEVSVRASDPDRLLAFDVRPPRMGLKPADRGSVRTVVKPKDTFLMGSSKRVPFFVHVDEPTAGSQQIGATLEQRPIIPGWVKPLAGLAVAAIAAIAILPGVLGLGATESPSPEPTQFVEAPTPTPEATLLVTLEPPTEEPSPTPTYGPPDVLVAAGDESGFMDATVSFACPPDNESCRDEVKARIRNILGNLQGKALGARLVSFSGASTGTLPITAEWDGWRYPYSAANGTITGELTRVAIDVAPLLVGGSAYALVEDVSGVTFTFVVAAEDAGLLKEEMYVINIVTPTPAPDTGGTFDLSGIYLRPIDGVLLRDYTFWRP